MILKGFKEKSNKKYIEKRLKNRVVHSSKGKVQSLGVVFSFDEKDDFDRFKVLASDIEIKSNKINIIAFTEDVNSESGMWDAIYNPKDFGWKDVIKNQDLKQFIDADFDLLISYYTKENTELKLITAASNAKLKVGVLQTDERFNDLIIKTDIKDIKTFTNELIKYLKILNKF